MKKTKKEKKVKVGKKTKMNGVLTALSVFAGVAVISGGTVLGVYLSGGFNEKIIMPASIDFVYNTEMYNEERGQLEIGVGEPFNPKAKQTFKLKITTPTEKVTKNEVTLSFVNQDSYNKPDSMGYISNTVIRLPQVVALNEEFEVELLTEDLKESEDSNEYIFENGQHVDWIKGGISTIQAQSADIEQTPKTLTIAVDVPVYETQTQIVNSNGQVVDKVVTNEKFTVKSKFIPAKSEYMFSDNESKIDESLWRTKKTFFQSIETSAITPVYNDDYTMHFVVGDEPATNVKINGYTYQTAYSQIAVEKNLTDASSFDYFLEMLEGIEGILPSNKIAEKVFEIEEANVGNYIVSKQSQTISMSGKEFRLFMNKYDYYENGDYLGVDIYSSSGELLDGMLKNIGIAFIDGENDATQGANASLSIVGGNDEENYFLFNGTKYYKSTIGGSNPRYSFWDLKVEKATSLKIKTILFVDNGTEIVPFEVGGEELSYTINFEITEHKESSVSWTNDSDINIMLDYDSNGNVVPQSINLANITNVPSTNLYQDVIYFISFGTQNKVDYQELADSVLGSSGYDFDRSGIYATEKGNFTLFAVEGSSITLYNTAEFTLYFATIITENGQPQFDQDGLYQIAVMSENSIRVNCEKSLNDKSVCKYAFNYDAFLEDGQIYGDGKEISIPQGSDETFIVAFEISKESVPVFEDEYKRGLIQPKILDTSKNDITSLFIIDSELFNPTGFGDEGENGLVTYRFKVKTASQIDDVNGIDFGYVQLNYNNNNDKNITWEFSENNNVCVYKPVSRKIEFNSEDYEYENILNGTDKVLINQTLNTSGEFETSITVMANTASGAVERKPESISALLTELIGNQGSRIVITDQKGKTDTLAGQWTFKVYDGDSQVISISADGKSFVFKNTDEEGAELKLSIVSTDNNVSLADNNQFFSFSIVSTGITAVAYSKTVSTYDTTINPDEKTTDIAKVAISKYGAKGDATDFIVLPNLVKFYLANGVDEYTNYSFKFNPQYISASSLPNTQLTALFGNEGMLTLYSDDSTEITFNNNYDPAYIRTYLHSASIYKIRINKNFAIGPTLQFSLSDAVGAVNTNLDLSLLANISISTEEYPNASDQQFTDGNLYAGKQYEIKSIVERKNPTTTSALFASLYSQDATNYYVVHDGERYVLQSGEVEEGAYVARFQQGRITFKDFWEVEEKEFRIYFQPEGKNYYALDHGITFKVTRDLNIESQNGTFYILSSEGTPLSNFVKVTRKSNADEAINSSLLKIRYTFNDYLDYDNDSASTLVTKKEGADFFFNYNKQELSANLSVSLADSGVNLAQIPVKIKLYQRDLYSEIAKAFTSVPAADSGDETITAQTQIIGDVEYLMVDISNSTSWKMGSLGRYKLNPSNKDYFIQSMKGIYEVVTNVTFSQRSALLTGIGDTSIYMVVKVSEEGSTATLATVHIPLIISTMGYESVVYENYEGNTVPGLNRRLETALTKPEELLKQKIYNEITAGELTKILEIYDNSQSVSDGGLYSLDGFLHTIKFYPFDTTQTELENHEDLIKHFSSSYDTVSLNHLAKSDKDVYLALEYIVENSGVGTKQSFYYLLKVVADIEVEESVYAYNGNAEYLTGQVNVLNTKNLEQLHDEYTLNDGYKPFNVSKEVKLSTTNESGTESVDGKFTLIANSDKIKVRFAFGEETVFINEEDLDTSNIIDLCEDKYFGDNLTNASLVEILIMEGDVEIAYQEKVIFKTLKFINEIASVTVGDRPTMTSADEWESYVQLQFSADYSTLEYRAKVEEEIQIIVKHSYVGSTLETDLAVVGGAQDYKIILNGNSTNYTVKFIEDSKETITDEYIIEIENGEVEENATGKKVYDLKILLIENDLAGGSQTGTIIPDILNVQYIKEVEDEEIYISDENFDSTTGIFTGYNKTTGEFSVILKDYISNDKSVSFAVFTEQGYLARLVLNLKSNAKYSVKTETVGTENVSKDVLAGGKSYSFADIFEIKLDDTIQEFANGDYTVKVENANTDISGDKDYVTWDNASGQIQVSDLIDNRSVVINFVVVFNENDTEGNPKEFKFSHELKLTANISKVSSYTSSIKTIAGQAHVLELENLYIGSLADSTTITISCESSSPAVNTSSLKYDEALQKWTIDTVDISATVTATLNLSINLNYLYDANLKTAKATQRYHVVYSFVVEPSVEITSHYPNPTKSTEMDFEYVDDGATFEGILTNFFAQKPVFGSEMRILMKNGDVAGVYDKKISYSDADSISIIISQTQNASLMSNASSPFSVNAEIAHDADIIFRRGTFDERNNKFVDSGNDSYIEFTITYKKVSQTYKVYIIANSLTVKLNYVSNYVSSGEYEGTTTENVNYETIYVDKTNTSNIFAGGRLAYAEMSDTMQTYANEYYLVFKEEQESATDVTEEKVSYTYYASYPIFFDSNDQSKDLYYDLGYSMNGKTFVGAYLTSAFEKVGLGQLNSTITVNKEIEKDGKDVETLLSTLTNFAGNLFADGVVTIANRVQLVYGQIDGKDNIVDYSWFENKVSKYSVSADVTEIGKISKVEPISSYDRDDGSVQETTTFNVSYYYMPNIDIDVTEKASSAINYIELEVNREYTSIASLFGIHHPTNKKLISSSDFATGSTSLEFTTIDYVKGGDIDEAEEYLKKLKLTEFKINKDGSDNTIYLFYAGIENASGNICDYSLLPLGAKNEGDFVLGKITYESSKFTKEFYVVVKVVPDYIVKFGSNAENNTTESDGAISNVNNVKIVSELNMPEGATTPEPYFKDFTLTGEKGYLSIKHKNGSLTSRELSSSNFNMKMPLDYKYETTGYNASSNIKQKIFYENHTNSNWTPNGTTEYKLETKADATFSKVKEVIFADQYYMIEGEDSYGFKFRLYFLLQASEQTPSVDGTISLRENGYFDVGVQYQFLSIEKDSENYYINSIPQTPQSQDGEVALINIQGIEAWLFDKDYTQIFVDESKNTPEDPTILKKNDPDGYIAGTGVEFTSTQLKYLSSPKLKYITINSIEIYDPSDTSNKLESAIGPTALESANQFATADRGTGFFNGLDVRGPFAQTDGVNDNTAKLWQVPRIENTDIFAGTNTADVLLMITLCYNDGSVIEYYDCPVSVNLLRDLSIGELNEELGNKIARDGQEIVIKNQFYVPFSTTNGNETEINNLAQSSTYINDTLEVLVAKNSTASFEMTLTRDGKTSDPVYVSISNTGTYYDKTNYISLSQYFKKNVKVGDTVSIAKVQNVSKFYYLNSGSPTGIDTVSLDETTNIYTLTIANIENDYIYLENADLLSLKSYHDVVKYYIMVCKIGVNEYSYQVSKHYYVTGYYYKMEQTFTTEIGFTMNETTDDGKRVVTFDNWNGAGESFTVNKAEYANAVVKETDPQHENLKYIQYSIDNTSASVGGMTVGNANIPNSTNGEIVLGESFNSNQYIKVVLRMAVSGADRNLDDSKDATYHYLGSLNLTTKR